jgi:hypothetical protein
LAVALTVATIPYWEVVLGRRTAMYGDVNDLFVPSYVAVWRQWMHFRLPVWTPNVFAGHSMIGAGQYAVFYPFNALFGVLPAVGAYRVWFLLHLWIATASAFAWIYFLCRSRPGAVVGAVGYSGCGFAVLHLVHSPFVIAVAWLPLVFLGVELVRLRWSAGRALVVAVPLAFIAFGGQPQMFWIAMVGLGAYIGGCAVTRALSVAASIRVALAVAAGIAVASLQLLPMALFSRGSVRPSLSMTGAFELSEHPRNLLTLVFPWIFGGSSLGTAFSAPWHGTGDSQHELGLFAGATIVVLAGIAMVRLRRRPVVGALTALGLLGLLIGLGDATPFGRLFYDVLPLARDFRGWARTMLLLNLALATLAGLGAGHVLRSPARRARVLIAAAAALGLVALALPHIAELRPFLVGGPYGVWARLPPILAVCALAGAVVVARAWRRAGAVLLITVCSLEVLSFAWLAEWRSRSAPRHDLTAFYDRDMPPGFGRPEPMPSGVDRWATDTYGFRMVSLAKDLRGINGYDPLVQRDWADTVAGFVFDGYPSRGELWQPGWLADVLRITTLVLGDNVHPTGAGWHIAAPVPGLGMTRWVRTPRLPEAYLVPATRLASLPAIRLALRRDDTPLTTMALVEDPRAAVIPVPGDAGAAAQAVPADDVLARGHGTLAVHAVTRSLLVLSHDWERGWHATIDGRSAPVFRTNGLTLGVVVPTGHHTVRLAFTPPGLRAGALFAALALVGLAAGGVWARRSSAAVPVQQRVAEQHGGDRAESEEGAEGNRVLGTASLGEDERAADHRAGEETGEEREEHVVVTDPSGVGPDDSRQAHVAEGHSLRVDEMDDEHGQPRAGATDDGPLGGGAV